MPMVVTDSLIVDNPIIYCNAAFLDLCGYGREEVLGQNYLFLIGPEAARACRMRARAVARFTEASRTPGMALRARSTRPTQEAQVIPSIEGFVVSSGTA